MVTFSWMDSPCIKQTACKVLKLFQHGTMYIEGLLLFSQREINQEPKCQCFTWSCTPSCNKPISAKGEYQAKERTYITCTWPRGNKTWGQSQTQNKSQWLVACGHVSTSSQSLHFILSLSGFQQDVSCWSLHKQIALHRQERGFLCHGNVSVWCNLLYTWQSNYIEEVEPKQDQLW